MYVKDANNKVNGNDQILNSVRGIATTTAATRSLFNMYAPYMCGYLLRIVDFIGQFDIYFIWSVLYYNKENNHMTSKTKFKYWVNFRGVNIPAHTLAEFAPINNATARGRLIRGWDVEVALVYTDKTQLNPKSSKMFKDILTKNHKKVLDSIEVSAQQWQKAYDAKFTRGRPIERTDAIISPCVPTPGTGHVVVNTKGLVVRSGRRAGRPTNAQQALNRKKRDILARFAEFLEEVINENK